MDPHAVARLTDPEDILEAIDTHMADTRVLASPELRLAVANGIRMARLEAVHEWAVSEAEAQSAVAS